MERPGFTPQLRGTLFSAMTGREGDVAAAGDDLRGMLLAAFGQGRRGGVDTRAAAQRLGVSQRTVQRWLAAEGRERQRPRPANLQAIRAQARRAATTRAGRRAALGPARAGPLARYGAKLTVRGQQGPTQAGRDYPRYRRVDLTLDPADVEAAWAAYERGGDRGLVGWMEGHFDQAYVAGWRLHSIDDLSLGDPREFGR